MIEGWKAASGNQTSVYAQDISLSRGRHPVVVEMYEATDLASIRFTYSKLETYRCWKAEYFDNPRLEGAPKITRNEDLLRFNWGNGSPEKDQGPENGFSARWTRKIDFPGGMTTFVMDTDDGARLKINGQTVVDGWADGAERTMSGTVNLTAGTHEIAIEYYENTGNASFRFYYDPGRQNRIWKGEYFDDAKLDGQATMITYANALNLDWGTGSPDLCAVPRDDFSARFTRDLPIERPGVYRFTVTVDDGVKVYLDGQMARDEWHDANSPTYSFLVDLQQGVTLLTVEYFEGRGFARIQMGEPEWVGDIPAPLPPSPTPTATPPPPTITPCHCS
jgi:hypothetical protein